MISLMVYDSQYSILNDSANFYIPLDNSFCGLIMFSLNSFLVMILLKKAYDRNHELWTQLLLKITRRKLISNKQTEIQSILITIVQGYMELIWGPENKQITSSSKLIFSSAYYFCGVSIAIYRIISAKFRPRGNLLHYPIQVLLTWRPIFCLRRIFLMKALNSF